jgi:hypothetical protein
VSTAIVASRIDTDPTCRRAHIRSRDFSLWHFENSDGTHTVSMLYVGGIGWQSISGDGGTFTAALDDAMDNLRSRIPKEDSQ